VMTAQGEVRKVDSEALLLASPEGESVVDDSHQRQQSHYHALTGPKNDKIEVGNDRKRRHRHSGTALH
jgi:hypothetical protein